MRTHNRSGKSLVIILVACAVVSLVGGAGIGLVMSKRSPATHPADSEQKAAEPPKTVFSLGDMVINLADVDNLRYAKLNVAVGIKEAVPEEKLKEHSPVLRDAIISVITNKQFDDLHSQGGTERLKAELQAATQNRVHGVTVSQVYFDSFAMQ